VGFDFWREFEGCFLSLGMFLDFEGWKIFTSKIKTTKKLAKTTKK
jgi:hypothetical protein